MGRCFAPPHVLSPQRLHPGFVFRLWDVAAGCRNACSVSFNQHQINYSIIIVWLTWAKAQWIKV